MIDLQERIIREVLREGSQKLKNSETPWLDATVLLASLLKCSREKLLASYPERLEEELFHSFMDLIEKRRSGHPVAYLTGSKEFFGRSFFVEQGILCPRPDTEVLIEAALDQIERRGYRRIHDLCTGSGCIALTLALENRELRVSASDISSTSESVFEKNRNNLCAGNVKFRLASLLKGLEGPLDLIVSNPPYLTTVETEDRMDQNWREPALALDGGEDGLDLIREIIRDAPLLVNKKGMLMMEADPRQMDEMERLMGAAGFDKIKRVQDLASHERLILGEIP
jgi:release factor glutamine methyltransferase